MLSDERLREIAAYQALDFAITHVELVGMSSELLSLREVSAKMAEALKPIAMASVDTANTALVLPVGVDAVRVLSNLRAALALHRGDAK